MCLSSDSPACGCPRRLLDPAKLEGINKEAAAELRLRKLDALRHRIRVLAPGVDAQHVVDEVAALRLLQEHGIEDLSFLQLFNLHRWAQ